MDEIVTKIEAMKARWMTGGSAEALAPPDWRGLLDQAPDLDLLALAGQFSRIAMRPDLAGRVRQKPLLPRLGLPPLPSDARPLFRRAIALKGVEVDRVVTLAAARGHAVSPLDWMPTPGATGLPAAYGPWLDWLADMEVEEDRPTAETWDAWSPQARLTAIEALRRTDPDEARTLIAEIAPTLSADARHRLIGLMATGLSDGDADYLTGLETDRSAKVQALARHLLARLGRAQADAGAQAELAAFFEVKRAGLLSRGQVVAARKLKTNAQRNRRFELAQGLPLAALADGLGIDRGKLIDAWSGGDGTAEIVAMTAATGTDDDADRLLGRLLTQTDPQVDVTPLFPRLSAEARLRHAPRIAATETRHFALTLDCLGPALGVLPYEALHRSATVTRLIPLLTKGTPDYAERDLIETALPNLGLIASRDAARRLLGDLQDAGLMAADPRLSPLRLNAALEETQT
ncbi:MAG: DUF5691 domain-containing protein [Pseudomonadota bacterium]